jgi:CheY-like chemotaxis protein
MLKLLLYVLESLHIKNITACANADEAFRLFCQGNYDIVLTDWMMEPVDGLTLTRRIRKSPLSPNKFVPIILITGYSSKLRVHQARDEGITEFLVKPFTASDLAKRIAYVINHPRDFVDLDEFFGPDRRRRNRNRTNYKGALRREEDKYGKMEIDFN